MRLTTVSSYLSVKISERISTIGYNLEAEYLENCGMREMLFLRTSFYTMFGLHRILIYHSCDNLLQIVIYIYAID